MKRENSATKLTHYPIKNFSYLRLSAVTKCGPTLDLVGGTVMQFIKGFFYECHILAQSFSEHFSEFEFFNSHA